MTAGPLEWIRLTGIKGLGPGTLKDLLERFGGIDQLLGASEKALLGVPRVTQSLARSIISGPSDGVPERELERAHAQGIRVLTWDEAAYPALLKETFTPPFVLYVKGSLESFKCPAIALVGSRAASDYGRGVCDCLAGELASRGIAVVSGLARGIDSAAHEGALRVGGKTLAVLGHGLGEIYPRENRGLARRITEGAGALVTEFRYTEEPQPGHFPRRNRIIAGLVRGVVVVEARRKSGSLITARLALEEGRDVFAVPGPVTSSRSEGAHRLIQDGAKLVHDVQDVLDEFGAFEKKVPAVAAQAVSGLDGHEEKIHRLLTNEPRHVDELALDSTLPIHTVIQSLTKLSVRNLVRELPGKRFAKRIAL